MEHQSRIAVFRYVKGNFWLLIFPLIRGLAALKFDVYNWLRGAYLDIVVIFLILGLAYLKWRFVEYKVQNNKIYIREGLLLKKETEINFAVISSASCIFPVWLSIWNAGIIELDSDAAQGSKEKKSGEIRLVLPKEKCSYIYNKIPFESSTLKVRCESSKADLVIFSILFSSALSGIIFLGTILIQGSRLLDASAEKKFFSILNDTTEAVEKFAGGITQPAALFVLIIISGWILSFIRNLIRHLRFQLCRKGKTILVENGSISKWKYYVNYSRINYADLQQNMLMKIFKIISVHVNCSGYGRKNRLPVFVPITRRRRVMNTMRAILPDFTLSNISIRPKKSYAAYLWLPIFMCAVVSMSAIGIRWIYSEWSRTVYFFAAVLGIPAIHLLIVRLTARFSSGIGEGKYAVTVRYCRGIRFHTVIVPRARIAYVNLRQSVFQRRTDVCDVWIYTCGERAVRHKVKGLDYAAARHFAEHFSNMS